MALRHLMLSRNRYVDLPPLAAHTHQGSTNIYFSHHHCLFLKHYKALRLLKLQKRFPLYLDEFVGPVVELLEGRLQVADAAVDQLGRPPRRPARTRPQITQPVDLTGLKKGLIDT